MATRQDVIFQGLTHSPSDYACQDGELATCLNLINEDGALHPIHQPIVAEQNITLDAGDTIELVHKVTHDEVIHSHYIIRKSDDTWYWLEKGGDGTKSTINLNGFHVNAVTAVGNILCFVGDSKTIYGYWISTNSSYTMFARNNFDYNISVSINKTESFSNVVADLADVFWDYFSWSSFGNDNEGNRRVTNIPADKVPKVFSAIDAENNRKLAALGDTHQKYNTFAVVAVRLYDGSYYNISNIFRLNGIYDTIDEINFNADNKQIYVSNAGSLTAYDIQITFESLEQINDLIQGVDVFLTKGNPFVDLSKPVDTFTFTDGDKHRQGKFYLPKMSVSTAKHEVDNLVFYHSIFISKTELGKKHTLKRVTEAEESIQLANLFRSDFGGTTAITYNNRLHIGNINTENIKLKNTYTSGNGVFDREGIIKVETRNNSILWKGMLSYIDETIYCVPINDVLRVSYYRHQLIEGGKYEKAIVNPLSSDSTAFSFYIGEDTKNGITFELPWAASTEEEWNKVVEEYKQYNKNPSVENSPNLLKVSEAENPLVFPAKNSVQVGSSVISALAANTRPISEGQFGDAPLYAFTDEGVWVLMLSEEGTYQTRQPAQRDICSNPKGILQIDDAVLFPTKRGIMMQQGRESVCITEVLDDYPFNFLTVYSHSVKDKTYPNKLLALGGIPEDDVKYVKFRRYLIEADMIYDYYDARIILFNPNYTYAYVYSLKSKMWGTMHNVFNKRVNIYPDAYATDKEGKILNAHVKEPTDKVSYFLCSRPLTLGQEIHKTMFNCITSGYFGDFGANKCGMVLFGSNDLMHWFFIGSSTNMFLRNLVGSPYKYFRIALMGSLDANESISTLHTDFQPRLQNRLR